MSKRTKLRTSAAFPMKAIIICDDLASASKVASTLERVGRQAGVNVQWTTKSWPMNALNESALAEQALVEASDAQLILFPENQAKSLPFWVFDWLGRWAVSRIIQDAALGIIKDKNSANFATPVFAKLARFARQHSLSLIVAEDRSARNTVRLPVHFSPERIMALHVAQINPVSLATPCSHRSFGINE